ncbi:MAG: fumarate hydratase [Deltaproteobacteria bacterium]|jgi:fumarate hydratase subunit alpha|nr:fumarate hydratase [Deltaproteobacteria bacterium]
MRELHTSEIARRLGEAFLETSRSLPAKVLRDLKRALAEEPSPGARNILSVILENQAVATREGIPLCQDTGLPQIKILLGSGVALSGAPLKEVLEKEVRGAHAKGYLRKSACHPVTRENLLNDIPVPLDVETVPGDGVLVFHMSKGGGCDNKSLLFRLPPTATKGEIIAAAAEAAVAAGPDACPPFYVGVAVGGTVVSCPSHSRDALFRLLSDDPRIPPPSPEERELALAIKELANESGLGPMGVGGKTTVLDLAVAIRPAHIASLPVAVNVCCHSFRGGAFFL